MVHFKLVLRFKQYKIMLKTRQKSLIHQTELDYISRCIQDCPNLEIGGDLFGFYTTTGIPVVQLATGPGPKAKQNAHSFYQDEDYLIQVGNELRDRFGMQHLGEWHSHHQLGLDCPSDKDDAVINNAIHHYNLPSFLLVIGTYNEGRTGVNCFRYFYESSRNAYGEHSKWVVLTEPSPIRSLVANQKWFSLHEPTAPNAALYGLLTTTLADDSAIVYPTEYWLNDDENKNTLHDILEHLKSRYSSVNIFQCKSSGIVFIDIKNTNDTFYRIEFKGGFPAIAPFIVLALNADCEGYLPSDYDWNPKASIFRQTVDYIDNVILELQNRFIDEFEQKTI
jgi:hypothetical protein